MQATATSHVSINTERKMLESDFVLVPTVVLSVSVCRPCRRCYLTQTLLGKQGKRTTVVRTLGKCRNKMRSTVGLWHDRRCFLEEQTLGLLHPGDYDLISKDPLEALYPEECTVLILGASSWPATPIATFPWWSWVAANLCSLRVYLLIDKCHLSYGTPVWSHSGWKESWLLKGKVIAFS